MQNSTGGGGACANLWLRPGSCCSRVFTLAAPRLLRGRVDAVAATRSHEDAVAATRSHEDAIDAIR